jgi:two-component system, NtrC family, sensor kinase
MTQTVMRASGVHYFYHETPPPSEWDIARFQFSQLQFPFFNMDPLAIIVEGHPQALPTIYSLFAEIRSLRLQTQLILINCQLPTEDLIRLIELRKPFKIVPNTSFADLERTLLAAMELSSKAKQDQVLLDLFNEQNQELKKLSFELEEKIDKRQKHLQETKEKLFYTNKKATFLQECLFTIHNSESIPELESNVAHALQEPLQLLGFRIFFNSSQSQNTWGQHGQWAIYSFPLIQDNKEYGSLFFARDRHMPFKREDRYFLDQLGEAISLCVERMLQIERNKDLQSQWQATFNSISDPVCLVDADFNIKTANQTFFNSIKNNPPEVRNHDFKKPLRLKIQKDSAILIFEVFRQTMSIDYQKHYFYLYRDISRQLGFERQLVESAKLAELGTISSSIAHELNNPLGGMLNFIQLIRMDLKGGENFADDIAEMEKGTLKCKNIVQNLLGFSRVATMNENQKINLEEVLNRAILITELRTRALGIRIDLQISEERIFVLGHFNTLTQVFCNILQNAYEAIAEKRRKFPQYTGHIRIVTKKQGQDLHVIIEDDGVGIDEKIKDQIFDPLFTTKDPEKNAGLGLTLAKQILEDHKAHIFVTTGEESKTCFSIHFPSF